MHGYEIRILKSYKQPSLVFMSMQINDLAAVQVAQRLAGDGSFEVWRDMDCVCRHIPNLSVSPVDRADKPRSAPAHMRQ